MAIVFIERSDQVIVTDDVKNAVAVIAAFVKHITPVVDEETVCPVNNMELAIQADGVMRLLDDDSNVVHDVFDDFQELIDYLEDIS